MQHYSSTDQNGLTPMVKNLLIINVLLFAAKYVLESRGIQLTSMLGLFHPYSGQFRPWQLLTHMFMHADIRHIFGNMLGLFFFGRMLEMRWGATAVFTVLSNHWFFCRTRTFWNYSVSSDAVDVRIESRND